MRAELLARANDVLDWVTSGKVQLRFGGTFPLAHPEPRHEVVQGRTPVAAGCLEVRFLVRAGHWYLLLVLHW